MNKFVITIILVCWLGNISAQVEELTIDSLQEINLSEIIVTGTKQNDFHASQQFNNRNIALVNQVNEAASVYVNQQGLGMLATLSVKGLSASSVPVLWNNYAINSTMNGVYDLSLINSYLFDQTMLTFANTQTSAGWSGAGASLSINHNKNKALKQIQYQYGSFGKQQIGGTYAFQKPFKKIQLFNQSRVIFHQADNDFKIDKLDTIRQVNGLVKEFGFINSTQISLLNDDKISLDWWWQNTNRQIPPPLGLRNTESHQLDSALRISLHWQEAKKNWNAGLAWFDELNQYVDPFYDINGAHRVKTLNSFVQWNNDFNNNWLHQSSLHYTFSSANSTNLKSIQNRHLLQLKSQFVYHLKKIPLSLKADIVVTQSDAELLPLRPGLYIQYQAFNNWNFKGQFSRHFRLPNFNDLYWQPGGNVNLKPESGYLQTFDVVYQNNQFKANLSIFNNNINDEIIWLPNGSLWQPQNLNKVNNRGFDISFNQPFSLNENLKFKLKSAYGYVSAILTESESSNSTNINKQLIYKPKHKISSVLTSTYQHLTAKINYQYTGKRFTTADHSEFVQAFHLTDLSFIYLVPIDKIEVELSVALFNVFNVTYQVIKNRSMPPRHFLLTANFKL